MGPPISVDDARDAVHELDRLLRAVVARSCLTCKEVRPGDARGRTARAELQVLVDNVQDP